VLIWTTVAQGKKRCPASEQRKRDAALLYELEMEFRKVGWEDPALVSDEEKDLFRFRDGSFAFSREHVNWRPLGERGRIKGILGYCDPPGWGLRDSGLCMRRSR